VQVRSRRDLCLGKLGLGCGPVKTGMGNRRRIDFSFCLVAPPLRRAKHFENAHAEIRVTNRIVAVVEGRMSGWAEQIVWQSSTRSIWWGVALIVLSMLGGSLLLAAVSVKLVIAWLIVLAGMAHLIIAHHAHRAGSLIGRLMLGFAYVFFGVYLIASPVLGVASFALVLASLFLLEGSFDITMFLRLRTIDGSNWLLLDGVVTLILGLIICLRWPSNAASTIGILVAVSLFACGVTHVMLSLPVRNALAAGTRENSRDDSSAEEYWEIHN